MGRDYRIGLIMGSILVGLTLLWVATRPSLTPQVQPAPSAPNGSGENPAPADSPATLPNPSPAPRTSEPPRPVRGESPQPTARDINTPAQAPRFHIVQSGETLSAIAQQYYGSSNAWRKILEANKTLKDANKIAPGTKLVIP